MAAIPEMPRLKITEAARSMRPPELALADLRESARGAGWVVVRDEQELLELWAEGALTTLRGSTTVIATADGAGASTVVRLQGETSRVQLLALARLREMLGGLAAAVRDPAAAPPLQGRRTASQQVVACFTLALAIVVVAVALAIPIPQKTEKGGREVDDLPSIALGSVGIYRAELALLCLYGGLIFFVPLYRGLGRGEMPIEISTQGARYEEVGATVTDVGERVETLESRLNRVAIDLSTLANRKNDEP